jgi:hypothetical protein
MIRALKPYAANVLPLTAAVRAVLPLSQAVASDKATMGRILSRTPMQRVGDPGEVASVVKL